MAAACHLHVHGAASAYLSCIRPACPPRHEWAPSVAGAAGRRVTASAWACRTMRMRMAIPRAQHWVRAGGPDEPRSRCRDALRARHQEAAIGNKKPRHKGGVHRARPASGGAAPAHKVVGVGVARGPVIPLRPAAAHGAAAVGACRSSPSAPPACHGAPPSSSLPRRA